MNEKENTFFQTEFEQENDIKWENEQIKKMVGLKECIDNAQPLTSGYIMRGYAWKLRISINGVID